MGNESSAPSSSTRPPPSHNFRKTPQKIVPKNNHHTNLHNHTSNDGNNIIINSTKTPKKKLGRLSGQLARTPVDQAALREEKEQEKAQEKQEKRQAEIFLRPDDRCIDDFYKIRSDEVLGKGTFGMVWLADCLPRSKRADQFCAVKTILREAMPVSCLAREVRMMQLCQQNNIVRVFDCFKTPQDISLVLELCEGGDLSSFCDKMDRPVPEKIAACWIHQALSAVDYLHNIGIIHRDIKPSNFFLHKLADINQIENPDKFNIESTQIKLGDFGLAIPYPTLPARTINKDPQEPPFCREKVIILNHILLFRIFIL